MPRRGGRPCAGYLCEDLVPGTFAMILIKLHHSATVCKSSTEMEILRHVFEARYYQVLQITIAKNLEMENGCIRVSAGPRSFPASPKNYVYDHVLSDLGSGARGPITSHLPKTMEIIMF